MSPWALAYFLLMLILIVHSGDKDSHETNDNKFRTSTAAPTSPCVRVRPHRVRAWVRRNTTAPLRVGAWVRGCALGHLVRPLTMYHDNTHRNPSRPTPLLDPWIQNQHRWIQIPWPPGPRLHAPTAPAPLPPLAPAPAPAAAHSMNTRSSFLLPEPEYMEPQVFSNDE